MWELCIKKIRIIIQFKYSYFAHPSWSILSSKSPWQQCLGGTDHTTLSSVPAAQHLITPLYFNSFWIMYLRVQFFHLDNITIHLGFFLLEEKNSSSLGKHGEWEKIIFNKQISDKKCSYTLNGRKIVFHMASTADSCLPCRGRLSPGSVVYASKTNNWSLRVALPVWFYDWSV